MAIFICVCAGVLALNLAREYSKYLEFMHAGEQEVTARVKLRNFRIFVLGGDEI
ncbi:hypothetical protein [uncultured Campylobacter sp.]|uniref:hypothetical protein n=1 Tax=uncultured Campylobacter sp. TaxID=218934 RepID=UPI0025D93256|nr:hypothetical protein [uncultured Campylobacter sp.]